MTFRTSARAAGLAIAAALAAGCAQPAFGDAPNDGYGTHSRPIAAATTAARRHFDRGLIWAYGFNHDEAVRWFERAQEADPGCAMAHWGQAWALGPNINLPLTDADVAAKAYAAARRAQALRDTVASDADRALIDAIAVRYAAEFADDRSALDQAFADAMRAAWRDHPDDPDVGAIYADALLNLSPWNQWAVDGTPKPNTLEIVAVLEAVRARHPDHPLANHLYIHATEASTQPERALEAARRLGDFAPAVGHLVHMPSHVYIRTARYAEAEDANRRALVADGAYFAAAGPQNIYEFYRAHNWHFIVYSAMVQGRSRAAIEASQDLVADFSDHLFEQMPEAVDGFLTMTLHAYLRFGRWDDVLAHPDFESKFPVARSIRRYARGVAYAATGRVAEARAEQQAFEAEAAHVGEEAVVGINPARPILDVARAMLEGEILYREGSHDAAFAMLRTGVEREEALRYDEPPPWMQPVRHALGALLLEVGRVDEAERVYREDLQRLAENGWALHGLAECLRRRGETGAALAVMQRFERAFANADIELSASCFCRNGVTAAAGGDASCCEDDAASGVVAAPGRGGD